MSKIKIGKIYSNLLLPIKCKPVTRCSTRQYLFVSSARYTRVFRLYTSTRIIPYWNKNKRSSRFACIFIRVYLHERKTDSFWSVAYVRFYFHGNRNYFYIVIVVIKENYYIFNWYKKSIASYYNTY